MANCISYSLFGYDKTYNNCYEFKSYLRNMEINIRMNRLIFPNWITHIILDEQTYNSEYKELFDYHKDAGYINISVVPQEELCKMMLFRLIPCFLQEEEGIQKYDRVLCRDSDSISTYREAQAVEYWMSTGRITHAITDSVSHNIPLMGGMIGFQTNQFRKEMGCRTFERLMELSKGIDFNVKGSDQIFLNQVVLPKVAYSMVEHYVLGLPQSFRGECYNYIQNINLDIPEELRESNILVNHIGQAGFIMEPVLKFLEKYQSEEDKKYFEHIEKKFPNLFYWYL